MQNRYVRQTNSGAGVARFNDRSHLGRDPSPPPQTSRRKIAAPEPPPPERGGRAAARAERVQSSAAARKKKSRRGEAVAWIIAIVAAVAVAFLIRAFLFEIILVDGESMEPTLITNERIGIEKISRYASLPERGDIIIVKYPDMEGSFVKRAIGLPGEIVEVRDSTVYIDGVPLEEDYVIDAPYADMEPVPVPEDHVFVMGDNRPNSLDSRVSYIGPIPRESILGHGLFVMWPLENIHMIND